MKQKMVVLIFSFLFSGFEAKASDLKPFTSFEEITENILHSLPQKTIVELKKNSVEKIDASLKGEVVLRLVSKVSLNKKSILLSDIAYCQDIIKKETKVDVCAKILPHSVFSLDFQKTKHSFSQDDVEQKIKKIYPKLALEWQGSLAVEIERKFKDLDLEELARFYETKLKDIFSDEENIKITKVDIQKPITKLSQPEEECEWSLDSKASAISLSQKIKTFLRHQRVQFSLICRDEETQNYTLQTQVEAMRRVSLATRSIDRGQDLKKMDIESAWIQLTSDNDLSPFAFKTGLVAKTNIQSGRVITERDFEIKKLIKRGDIVQLSLGGNKIKVLTTAEANQDGAEGDMVVVAVQPTKRLLKGIVQKDRTVKIDL